MWRRDLVLDQEIWMFKAWEVSADNSFVSAYPNQVLWSSKNQGGGTLYPSQKYVSGPFYPQTEQAILSTNLMVYIHDHAINKMV